LAQSKLVVRYPTTTDFRQSNWFWKGDRSLLELIFPSIEFGGDAIAFLHLNCNTDQLNRSKKAHFLV